MPKHREDEPAGDAAPEVAEPLAFADALLQRGRDSVEGLPAAAESAASGAREVISDAQDQVDRLSDTAVVAAVGFSLGFMSALFLAGAPRAILAMAAIPVALTVRSALGRGIGR